MTSMSDRILSILILLIFCTSAIAQTDLPGKYKNHRENDGKLDFNYILLLNCDKTFMEADSLTGAIVWGSWTVRANKKLILFTDSIIIKSKISTKSSKGKYFIKDGNLFHKMKTQYQYRRSCKRDSREMWRSVGEPQHYESYERYKARQENRYLEKISSFRCK
jgi:hypothetical protein